MGWAQNSSSPSSTVWKLSSGGTPAVRRPYQHRLCRSSGSRRTGGGFTDEQYTSGGRPFRSVTRRPGVTIEGMSPCSPPGAPEPAVNRTGRIVHCVKFQKDLPGLDAPPWPGELGQRIYDNVSLEAWRLWEDRMKMMLNEYRLLPFQKEAQDLVAKHMEEFFFGEGAALPPGYVPQQAK